MSNKGFIHFAPLVIIPVIILAIVGGIFYKSYKSASENGQVAQIEELGNEESEATSPAPTSQTPTVSSKPQATVPTPTGQPYSGVCQINVLAGSNPNEVILVYGLTSSGGKYMKEARWDLDNNGQWDLDFSPTNTQVTTSLPSGGSKTVRLQLKLSDDSLTDVCTKSVSAPSGTWITIWGYVFSDNNCSGFMDGSESGIAAVPVRITKTADYSIYGTANTDGSGKFSYSTLLNELIDMTVGMTSPSGYKSHPTHTIGSSTMGYGKNTNVQMNIPQVPNASVGQCVF